MSLMKPNLLSRFINWLRTPKYVSPAQRVSDPRRVDPAPKLYLPKISDEISDEKPAEFDPEATLIMNPNGGRKNGKVPTE